MAEVKNAFVSSKMNLDLDDRLIPQGQYREGVNIQVSKSEGPNVGALENVLGNQLLKNFVALTGGITGLQIIGEVTDPTNNTFYFFLTDYREPDPTGITFSSDANNYIYSYNVLTEETVQLVSGSFLNFSITSPIYGVNIVENLLFWTDNRNQPRKINLSYSPGYYTTEDHISVAKIMPINAINLYQQSSVADAYECTMQDVISPNLPDGTTPNPYEDANYPGDPDFLEDKFVRFSYRFKFDDNEYSVLAPFTQECFIPKQDGYFLPGDQESTYRSTIVSFMENKVNKIILKIPLPLAINGTAIVGSALNSTLKIKEIDIIYKESDSQAVQVVDTILSDSFSLETTSNISYTYQCTKPYKTLPESTLVRVYDKVPVRAFSQEVSGNRVIYGNFQDKHTPPQQPLDYQVGAFDKSNFFQSATDNTLNTTSLVEYPNHTLKQNRNYQVGLVLSDRYGRSSTTLLSKENTAIAAGPIESFGASTYYHPYRISTDTPVSSWPGDALKIFFNNALPTKIINLPQGLPGEFQGQTSDITNPYNPLGWYSYKVVVKQFEQEYYNVYLPGALNAYPGGVNPNGDAANSTAFITLINDNINKVPRDLSEVGPEQKQYRSSVQLFGRVTPDAAGPPTYNKPFFPGNASNTVNTIAEQNFILGTATNDYEDIYQTSSNPYLARITQAAGLNNSFMGSTFFTTNPTEYQLAVYETNPVESRLDIYYETSTTGVISQLNQAINSGTNNVEGLYGFNITTFNEATVANTTITNKFAPKTSNSLGQPFNGTSTITIVSVFADGQDETANNLFAIERHEPTPGVPFDPANVDSYLTYTIKTLDTFYYGFNADVNKRYFVNIEVTPAGAVSSTTQLILPLENVAPTIMSDATLATPLANPFTVQKEAGNIGVLQSFYGVNGTVKAGNTQSDLAWSITSPLNQTVFQITNGTDANGVQTGELSTQQDLSGPYPLTIQLTDAGGEIDTRTINVIFGEEALNIGFGAGSTSGSFGGGSSSAIYWVNNLTNAAGSTPLPGNTQNNDIRAPYTGLQLPADAPTTTNSVSMNSPDCTNFTMYNNGLNALTKATGSPAQSEGGLSSGTAFIAVNINFRQYTFGRYTNITPDDANGVAMVPFVIYPTYLQYRNITGIGYPNNWVNAIDIEGSPIRFGGSQVNKSFFPSSGFQNNIAGTGVVHSATIAESFVSNQVNAGPASFGNSIDEEDCLEAQIQAPRTSTSADQSTIARKVFAIGKQQQSQYSVGNKFGDYRLIIRYPWGETTTQINPDPIVVGYGTGVCPSNSQFANDTSITASIEFGDFYYPKAYGGSNIYSYPYRISALGANTNTEADELAVNVPVFAREWHLKYVSQFYTDPDLTIKWTPGGGGNKWYAYTPSTDNSSIPAEYGTDYANTSPDSKIPIATSDSARKWTAYFNLTGLKQLTTPSQLAQPNFW